MKRSFKFQISNFKLRKGFTLVELLVVIGILGILAAGLLAAIDPLEQLKKGRDQNRRNIAVEYHNALTRYYSTYGSMPWGTGATGAVTLSAVQGGITATLINTGELKSTFNSAAGNAVLAGISIIAQSAANGGDTYICFDPESKSVSLDPTTLFSDTSNPPGTAASCNPPTATSGCYFCAR